jgi:hypothetical protein
MFCRAAEFKIAAEMKASARAKTVARLGSKAERQGGNPHCRYIVALANLLTRSELQLYGAARKRCVVEALSMQCYNTSVLAD